MSSRDLNRRAVVTILVGGVLSQGVYGLLRALTLLHNRDYSMARYGVDPMTDIVINIALAAAAVIGIGLLFTGWRAAWWWSVVAVAVGVADALRLSVSGFAGPEYLGLLVLRAAVLYVFTTPLVRAVYGIGRSG